MTETAVVETMRTRWSDGAEPVEVLARGDGGRSYRAFGEEFASARSLLIRLTGHPEARHWTYARYFRLGRWSPAPALRISMEGSYARRLREDALGNLSLTVLDILGPAPSPLSGAVVLDPGSAPAIVRRGPGIDLDRRGHEVARLLHAGFGDMMRSRGYDPAEVLQEVYKGLLVRNRGKCPWDPAKSSFGHYVHMVCRCVVFNFHRRQGRLRSREQVGVAGVRPGYNDGVWENVDVASDGARLPASAYVGRGLDELPAGDIVTIIGMSPCRNTADGTLALAVLPLVRAGMTRGEIADRFGVSKASVSRALSVIRACAAHWRDA